MARVQVFNDDNTPVDLNAIAPWDGEGFSITPGDYIFAIESVAQTQSSSGKPQLELGLTVVNGTATEQHNGQSMKHWISLTAKAAPRLRAFLDAAGVTPDTEGGFDDDELVGKQFMAEVYEDEYQKGVNIDGTPNMRKSTKIRKERPVEGIEAASAAAPAPAPAPTAKPVSKPATSVPAKPSVPALPKVATALPVPGQRVPLPRK